MTRRRPCASSRGSSSPAAASRWSSSASRPRRPLRALWRVYTRIGLPAVGRLVSPAWQDVGRFLGPNIEQFHAREPDLAALWRAAGIDHVQTRAISFGAGIVMSGVRSRNGERPS